MKGFNIKDGCVTVKFYYREPMSISTPSPSCLYEFMSLQEYKNLMYLSQCLFLCLYDYLEDGGNNNGKQRKSKKKS